MDKCLEQTLSFNLSNALTPIRPDLGFLKEI
jgi:hypothetical protein